MEFSDDEKEGIEIDLHNQFQGVYPVMELLPDLIRVLDVDDLALFAKLAPDNGWKVFYDYENERKKHRISENFSFVDFAKEIVAQAKIVTIKSVADFI